MLTRNGVDPGELSRDEWRYGYPHVFRSGIFRVAEDEGELVSICHAIVRGPSGSCRASGLGLIGSGPASAVGCCARCGTRDGHVARRRSSRGRRSPSDVAPLSLETTSALDRDVIGTAREIDHGFWLTEPGRIGRAVVRDGRALGYYYARRHDRPRRVDGELSRGRGPGSGPRRRARAVGDRAAARSWRESGDDPFRAWERAATRGVCPSAHDRTIRSSGPLRAVGSDSFLGAIFLSESLARSARPPCNVR